MTSTSARAQLEEMFPSAKIIEAPGGPNLILGFLFFVDGDATYVDFDGSVLQPDPAPSREFKIQV